MKTSFENNTLTIYLDGRVDTNNAAQTEEEIFSAADGNTGDIVIDAERLEYISSAGLRVLMKLRKKYGKPLSVINVSRDVYDIFETTGFTELLNVRKAFRRVSTEGMKLIGKGITGEVYRMDDETVIKVFNPNVSFDMLIAKENTKARNAFISGVPTAIPYDIVRVGDSYGTVYEMLDAKDLVTVIAEDKSRIDELITSFAKKVREMHSIKVDKDKFADQKTEALGALKYLSSLLTDEEMTKLRNIYENVPDRDTFVHGDCHVGNVMINDGEMMFIDLATSGMGHPIFDLMSMYSLFCDRADDPTAIAKSPILSRFTREEIKHIWDLYIRTYLGTDDEALIKKAEHQLATFAYARRLFMMIALPGSLTPEEFAAMKKKLFGLYDSSFEPICF